LRSMLRAFCDIRKQNKRGGCRVSFYNRKAITRPAGMRIIKSNFNGVLKRIGRGLGLRKSSGLRGDIFGAFFLMLVSLPSSGLSETVAASQIYVVDGDTIDISGERVRLLGFDTPETYRARCNYEKRLGDLATARVRELLGGVVRIELVLLPGRDRYDRLLGRLIVNGTDVGDTLMAEGLARRYDGGRRQGWCG